MTFRSGASYVPQVARTLQTFPVIAPGAFPNGLGSASPYTAEVFAASFASAEAQAQKDYEETEAARQRAKKQEEEEFLSWCRSEGGCGANEGEAEEEVSVIDPHARVELSSHGVKLISHALTVGGPILATLLSKWVGGIAGVALAEALKLVSSEALTGLNRCLTAWRNGDEAKGFRCGLNFEYFIISEPPGIIPWSLEFEDCWEVGKGKPRSCWTTYSISWINLLK